MSEFDCPYELWVNNEAVRRCAYRTPMNEAVASAQRLADELATEVRLYFGGKSYDIVPAAAAAAARALDEASAREHAAELRACEPHTDGPWHKTKVSDLVARRTRP